MNYKLISIVIPAFNCESTMAEAIHAVLNQDYRGPKEIIVVDDGSTDLTAGVVKSFASVRYFRQDNMGPAVARNRGFQESKGELIFFTDSDCVPRKDWITKAVVHFENPQIAVVAGSYGIANDHYLLARCIYKEIIFRHHRLMPEFPKSFGSYNFSIRRSVFEEAGGFNIQYRYPSGEDNDLSYKIIKRGGKIYFEKGSLVDHYFPVKVGKYLCEQFRHGFWRARIYAAHPKMALGDDYTFWKDIVEPPLVLSFFLCLFLAAVINFIFFIFALFFSAALLTIEIFYAFLMTKSTFEGIFFSAVMLSRAVVRSFGFVLGIPPIFAKNHSKKK